MGAQSLSRPAKMVETEFSIQDSLLPLTRSPLLAMVWHPLLEPLWSLDILVGCLRKHTFSPERTNFAGFLWPPT